MLEVEDIQKIDVINIDPNVVDKGRTGKSKNKNILDSINEDAMTGSG